MASEIFLQIDSDIDASAFVVYLSGTPSSAYTGSGSPWTSQSTTPFSLGNNQKTGQPWTPTVAPVTAIFAGNRVASMSRDRVKETIPIQIRASTADNCLKLLNRLRRWMNASVNARPVLLGLRPNTTTSYCYFEIYSADIQEHAAFLNEEAGSGVLRCQATIERSAVAGLLESGLSATMSGSTFGNGFGSATTNLRQYPSSFTGDLIEAGVPLNITLSSFSASTMTKLYMATIYYEHEDTTSAGAYSTSDTVTGVVCGSTYTTTLDLTGLNGNQQLRPRFLARFSAVASNAEVRMGVGFSSAGPIWYGPWIDPANTATVVDFGTFPIDRLVDLGYVASAYIYIYVRSTDGSSASVTLGRNCGMLYYQFAAVDTALSASVSSMRLRSFNSSAALLAALPRPAAVTRNDSGANVIGFDTLRGDMPRGYPYSFGQLWMCWLGTSGAHSTSETLSCAVEYAALYRSLRGNS